MKIWSLKLLNNEIMRVDDNLAYIILQNDIPLKIGRASSKKNNIIIRHLHIAREHCEIFPTPFDLYIKPCSSSAPTYVNNKPLKTDELTEIFAGQIISLGKVYNPEIYDLNNYSYLVSCHESDNLHIKVEIKEEIDDDVIIIENTNTIKLEPESNELQNTKVNPIIKQENLYKNNESYFLPSTSNIKVENVNITPNLENNTKIIIPSHGEASQDFTLKHTEISHFNKIKTSEIIENSDLELPETISLSHTEILSDAETSEKSQNSSYESSETISLKHIKISQLNETETSKIVQNSSRKSSETISLSQTKILQPHETETPEIVQNSSHNSSETISPSHTKILQPHETETSEIVQTSRSNQEYNSEKCTQKSSSNTEIENNTKNKSDSSISSHKRKRSKSKDDEQNKISKRDRSHFKKDRSKEHSSKDHTSKKDSHSSRKSNESKDKEISLKRTSEKSENTNNSKVFIQSNNNESKLSLRVNVNKEISVPVTETLKIDLRNTQQTNQEEDIINHQLFTPPHEIIIKSRNNDSSLINSDTESTSSNDFQSINNNRKIKLIEPLPLLPRNRFNKRKNIDIEENKKSISETEVFSPKDDNKVQINVESNTLISNSVIKNETMVLINNEMAKKEEDEYNRKIEASKIRPSGPIRRISRVPSLTASMESYTSVPGQSVQDISTHVKNIKFNIDEKKARTLKKLTVTEEEKERIILSLVHWDIKWITEDSNTPPPVWKREHIHCTNDEYIKFKEEGENVHFYKRDSSQDDQILPKALNQYTFDSFTSYIETMLQYILLHLWYVMYKNYKCEKRQLDAQVIGTKDEEKWKRSLLVYLNVSTTNNAQNLAADECPNVEDFIIIKLQNKSRNLEDVKFQQYIGHVKNYLYLGSDLQKDANGKSFFIHKHKIDVLIKYPKHEVELFQKVIINPINQIGDAVKKISGLFHLSSSPLMNIILQPKKNNLQQPIFLNNRFLVENSLQTLRHQLQTVLPISDEQKKIITPLTYTLCCKEPSLNVIDGKAGTGKTQTLAWLALSLLADRMFRDNRLFQQRLLIVTSSQTALNDFATKIHQVRERIIKGNINDFNMVVLGRAGGNLNSCINQYTLEEQTKKHGDGSADRDKKYQEILNLAHLIIVSMETITNTHFTEACADKMKIAVCFVDDAQNVPEIHTLLPLVSGVTKLVLAGDITLPKPRIECKDAANLGLKSSLIARVYKVVYQEIEKKIKTPEGKPSSRLIPATLIGTTYYFLTKQIRMSSNMLNMRNQAFSYVRNVCKNTPNSLPINPFAIFDCIMPLHQELNLQKKEQYEQECLRQEAKFAVQLVLAIEEKIRNSRSSHKYTSVKTIIMTPETLQAQEAQKTLDREREYNKTKQGNPTDVEFCTKVRSVNHTLSNEADIVVLCLGQSEKSPLLDPRTIHLALTRAKSTFIIIGNFNYFIKQCKMQEWINLVNYSRRENSYFQINPKTKIQEILKNYINSNQMLKNTIMSPSSPPEDFGPELPENRSVSY